MTPRDWILPALGNDPRGITAVQAAVAEASGLKVSDLTGPSRRRPIAHPRQLAMRIARDVTGASFPEIGAAFGGRDHTTVIHACRATDRRLAADPDLRAAHDEILRRIEVRG